MRSPMLSGVRRAARRRSEPMAVLAVADPALRRQCAACLAESGFVVVDCARADEALASAKRLLPDFVVVDFELPGTPLLRLVRQLRDDPATMDAGVVALARGVTPYRETVAIQAGCDVLLEAPCTPEALLTELLVLYAELDASQERDAASPGRTG